MPDLDSFEFCRRLQADARTCEIPVIFVTALGDRRTGPSASRWQGGLRHQGLNPMVVRARSKPIWS